MDINIWIFYNEPSEHICGAYSVPGSALSFFYMLIYLILTATILGETYYYLYFENKGTKTSRQ